MWVLKAALAGRAAALLAHYQPSSAARLPKNADLLPSLAAGPADTQKERREGMAMSP